MRIIKCKEETLELLEELTSKKFLELDPVIAGGFAVWLFQTARSKPNKLKAILNSCKNSKFSAEIVAKISSPYGIRRLKYPDLITYKYNDIDSWFLSGNDIWLETHPLNNLVNPKRYKADIADAGKKIGFETLEHKSDWAHSLARISSYHNRPEKLQIITKPYSTVDSLLESFDLNNCKVACYKGSFYVSDDFIDSILKEEILINEDHWKKSVDYQKIQTVLRAFKYHQRTGFYLSADSVDKAFEVFNFVLESDLTKEKLLKTKGLLSLPISFFSSILPKLSPRTAHMIDTYGKGRGSKNSFVEVNKRLLDSFSCLVVQPGFERILPFFVGTGYPNIDNQVEAIMQHLGSPDYKQVSNIEEVAAEEIDYTSEKFDFS